MATFEDVITDVTNPGIVTLKRSLPDGSVDEKQVYNMQAANKIIEALRNRLNSVESAGAWIGTVGTVGDLPTNVSAFDGTNGLLDTKPTAGDFVNVQNVTYWKNSNTGAMTISNMQGTAGWTQVTGPARFIIVLGAAGACTWEFDLGFSADVDLSGKADKVTDTDAGEIFVSNGPEGNLAGSGKTMADVVQTSGNQNIGGEKHFTGTVTVPDPSANADAANKKYVDDAIKDADPTNKTDKIEDGVNGNIVIIDGGDGNIADSGKSFNDVVQTSGNQTIAGKKQFSGEVLVPDVDEESDDNAATTKKYVDELVIASTGVGWEFEALD